MKDYKEKNNFILGTTVLEMLHSHAKMCLNSAPQKPKMVESISKIHALDCSCKCLLSLVFGKNHFLWNQQHFLARTIKY